MTAGETTWRRTVRPAASYASANDPRILIGLGNAAGPIAAVAYWPGGAAERWSGLAPGRYHTLRRGTGSALEPAKAGGGSQ